jgi:hypothetical protein
MKEGVTLEKDRRKEGSGLGLAVTTYKKADSQSMSVDSFENGGGNGKVDEYVCTPEDAGLGLGLGILIADETLDGEADEQIIELG